MDVIAELERGMGKLRTWDVRLGRSGEGWTGLGTRWLINCVYWRDGTCMLAGLEVSQVTPKVCI